MDLAGNRIRRGKRLLDDDAGATRRTGDGSPDAAAIMNERPNATGTEISLDMFSWLWFQNTGFLKNKKRHPG